MDACLIINRNSRRSRRWGASAVEMLGEQGVSVVRQWHVKGSRLMEAGKEAANTGINSVLIGGGDGTFSGLAKFFAHTEVTIGVLPFGTGNSLAYDLEIPADPVEACRVIGQGHVALIDLGRIGDRYFVNHVAAGASTLVSKSLSAGSKRWLGKLAYLLAAIKAFPSMRSFELKLIMDDEEVISKCMQVVAGNGRHHAGPFLLSPDASRSNGKLLLYWLASDERKRLLLLISGLRSGHHIDMPDVEMREVKHVRIETSRPIGVSIDGELGFRTPIELSIDPKALRVFVPPPASV